jgi:hypothetical protein
MTLTTVEVENAIEAYNEEAEEIGSDFVETLEYSKQGETVPLSVGDAVEVDAKWGKEGGGDKIWVVFRIGDQLFRKEGYYSSYNGDEWEEGDITEVKQIPKTVFVYEPVS